MASTSANIYRYVRRKAAPSLLVVLIGLLIFPPLILLIWVSFTSSSTGAISTHFSLSSYLTIFESPGLLRVILNTVVFAIISGVVGGVLGTIACYVSIRTTSRLRRIFYAVPIITFLVPGVLQVLGWELLFGTPTSTGSQVLAHLGLSFNLNSFFGMCLLQSLASGAITFIILIGPMSAMGRELEEAAMVSGATPGEVFSKVTLRLLAPALASATLLATMLSFQSLEIPLILGSPAHVQTIASTIYLELSTSITPNYSLPAAFGCLLAVFLLVMYWLYVRLTRSANRYVTVTGRGYRATRSSLGKAVLPTGIVGVLLLLMALVPFITMVWLAFSKSPSGVQFTSPSTFGLQNFRQFSDYPAIGKSFINSAIVGALTATGGCLLGLIVAYRAVRVGDGLSRLGEALMNMPLAIPAVAFGFAELVVSLNSPVRLYGTLWIFVLFNLVAFGPFVLRVYSPALISIGRDLEDAARIAGGGNVMTFRRITAPLVGRSVWTVWIFMFLFAFREFGGSIFLVTPSTPVVGVQLYELWVDGYIPALTALATAVSGVGVVGGLMLLVMMRLRRRRTQLRPAVFEPSSAPEEQVLEAAGAGG